MEINIETIDSRVDILEEQLKAEIPNTTQHDMKSKVLQLERQIVMMMDESKKSKTDLTNIETTCTASMSSSHMSPP